MSEHKQLYVCDPDKNTKCRKTGCIIYGGPCRCTLNSEYAATDTNGNPIEYRTLKYGVWHDVRMNLPPKSDTWVQVLIVKQLKSGERKIEIGQYLESVGWVTSNGKGKVLYWAPLPKIPTE